MLKLATTVLVFCVGALLALGMTMLYSASMMQAGAYFLKMQLLWCLLGLAGCVLAASVDYRRLKKMAPFLIIVAAVLLVLVLIPPLGKKINGARRWIVLGGFRLQPAELAKLALILFLAFYIERYHRHMGTFKRGIVIPGAVIGGLLGLVFLEPDVGTMLLIALVGVLMLTVGGAAWKYLLPPVFIGAVAVGLFLWQNPMRSERIYSWLHLEETKEGIGHQQYQSRLAIGAGGWTGVGLGNSRQKNGFVPEHQTDFIFSIIGEELGLVATMAVVAAFLLFVVCGIYIASCAPDMFGLMLGAGVTFMIGFQAFINMGVVTALLPNKGMPLPFISYGGSNLLVMLACTGLLLNVARHAVARERMPRKNNPFMEPSFSGDAG